MRNPKRIKDIMSLLTEIWEMYPDLRFNQLIIHLQNRYDNSVTDYFNVEDNRFIGFLQSYYHDLQNEK